MQEAFFWCGMESPRFEPDDGPAVGASVVPFECRMSETHGALPSPSGRGIAIDRKSLRQAAFTGSLDRPHFKRTRSTSSETVAFDLFVHIQQ